MAQHDDASKEWGTLRARPLMLYPTNLRLIVGRYRGKGPEPERGGKGIQLKAAGTLSERPKGEVEMEGQGTGRLS